MKKIVADVIKRSKVNFFFKKKKKKKHVNFDFKDAQKFFETANGLETLSIVKPICEVSKVTISAGVNISYRVIIGLWRVNRLSR